ncbi:MAG TPA: TrmH family RNA methyltransferase, partial [Gemmatimonadales bacterium]|nr:TrmH family RNA methyltransferase [Gemmatimonadales bacterium]
TEQRVVLWSAAMDGDPIAQVARETHGAIALVVGNEGAGVSDDVARMAQRRVAIPITAAAESLNVAVAAGILLYEVTRVG